MQNVSETWYISNPRAPFVLFVPCSGVMKAGNNNEVESKDVDMICIDTVFDC